MPPFDIWLTLALVIIIPNLFMGLVAVMVLFERWISAWMQDRLGPNRVGPKGTLQTIVDVVKLLIKEDIIPSHVDRVFYLLAPGIAAATALLAFAVVPFGPTTPPPLPQENMAAYSQAQLNYAQQITENHNWGVIAPGIDIGILFTFAVTSLAVYGIILGGWSSNSKYSMLGSLRSSAQLVSYEIPLGMSILGVVLFSGSLNLERIIADQVDHGWNIIYQPLAFVMFLTGAFAECNRLPFDLPEAEQELVGGYHTEYSSMKFALYFLAEYIHMLTTSFLFSVVFFGGWHFPGLTGIEGWLGWALKLLVMVLKVSFFIGLYMVIRWTIPRFRFDQLMGLAWKVLIPLATLYLLAAIFVREFGGHRVWMLSVSAALLVGAGAIDLTRTARRINLMANAPPMPLQ